MAYHACCVALSGVCRYWRLITYSTGSAAYATTNSTPGDMCLHACRTLVNMQCSRLRAQKLQTSTCGKWHMRRVLGQQL